MTVHPERITVVGAKGWIGAALVADLKRKKKDVIAVDRKNLSEWLIGKDTVGMLIYAIGLTADFRERPHATVEAHVSLLSKVMMRTRVENLLLLSSTRVYKRSNNTSENTLLQNLSSDSSDLYNLSKLLGEALVLQDPRPSMKVVRLSNVVGLGQPQETFIGMLLDEARRNGSVVIKQSSEASKNYVGLKDVVRLIPQISKHGLKRLYNLGSSKETSNDEIAEWLRAQGAEVTYDVDSNERFNFAPLTIDRLAEEFETPSDPFDQKLLIKNYQT